MRQERSMKTLHAMAVAMAMLFASMPLQAGKPATLPQDSVYQLTLPLTDAQGRTQDWRTLQGKPRMVAMFYTSCQYMCPLIVESGKAVEHALPANQRDRIGVVLISLDPAKDTPAALRAMAKARKVDANRWTLAAPEPDDVRKVAGVLGVRYRVLADGNFNHTSALILLDAQGRILARTERMGSKPDPEFVAAVSAAAR
jgi:protein SCO1/2